MTVSSVFLKKSKRRERHLKGENDKIYDKIISNNNFYFSWWS